MTPCYCNSQLTRNNCCLPIINGQKTAPTPEALMRARYSAYSTQNISFIKTTCAGPALQMFDESASKNWAKQMTLTGLTILAASHTDTEGQVTFMATYIENAEEKTLFENSLFKKVDGQWMYWSA